MALAGLQWSSCLVYLDDVIILGKTFQEHVHHLREVFECVRGAGLKLKPAKCKLCSLQVEFLGHNVSAVVGSHPGCSWWFHTEEILQDLHTGALEGHLGEEKLLHRGVLGVLCSSSDYQNWLTDAGGSSRHHGPSTR